ncbi:MAG: hypothetical protein IPO22_14585 [Anaerolineales bacterium]|nr:hypothetical protein [Anaerolineales bacterium]
MGRGPADGITEEVIQAVVSRLRSYEKISPDGRAESLRDYGNVSAIPIRKLAKAKSRLSRNKHSKQPAVHNNRAPANPAACVQEEKLKVSNHRNHALLRSSSNPNRNNSSASKHRARIRRHAPKAVAGAKHTAKRLPR